MKSTVPFHTKVADAAIDIATHVKAFLGKR